MKYLTLLPRAFYLSLCILLSCQSPTSENKAIRITMILTMADSLSHVSAGKADSLYRLVLRDSSGSNHSNYVKALVGLASVDKNRGALDTAFVLLNRAFEMACSMRDTALMMECILSRGNINLDLGNSELSESCFKEGLDLAKKYDNEEYQNKFLLSLGNAQHDRGEYPAAVKTFTEGVKIAETAGDGQTLASALENLAFTLKYTGELREAILLIQRSLQIRKKLNLMREYAMGLQNLGILYRNADKNDSALMVYHQAYEILLGLNDSVNMVKVRYNIGIILKNQKKFREAEEEMKGILQFCREKSIRDGEVYALSALASVYQQTGRSATGLASIDSAISLARQFHMIANLTSFLDRRHEILAGMGRYREAYTTALISGNISDSLLSLEKQKEIASIQIRFETERKEAENIILKKNLQVQKTRIWMLWLLSITGALTFIMVTLVSIYRNNHLKQQKLMADQKAIRQDQEKLIKDNELEKIQWEANLKEEKIEQLQVQAKLREQELVLQSLIRADLTQVNRSVKEKLFPFQYRLTRKKDQEEFLKALQELTRDAGKDPLAEFEMVFSHLHIDFFERLIEQCPSLTKTELQVCAMLRLNLSSKDIARLVNLTVSTIETTRFHIRKKLILDPKVSLTAYLIQV
ncbi:MAG: tetratricopeptide repeat protein [Bacteroidota bacterium]